jgi:hypothetical protein
MSDYIPIEEIKRLDKQTDRIMRIVKRKINLKSKKDCEIFVKVNDILREEWFR